MDVMQKKMDVMQRKMDVERKRLDVFHLNIPTTVELIS